MEACLTQYNLQRRGYQMCTRCLLCEVLEESQASLLVLSLHTSKMWSLFFNTWTLKLILDFLKSWDSKKTSARQLSVFGIPSHQLYGGPIEGKETIQFLKANLKMSLALSIDVYFCYTFGASWHCKWCRSHSSFPQHITVYVTVNPLLSLQISTFFTCQKKFSLFFETGSLYV